MKKKMGIAYKIGVVVSFLSVAGIAEAITGRGDGSTSTVLFIVGLLLCLIDYIK